MSIDWLANNVELSVLRDRSIGHEHVPINVNGVDMYRLVDDPNDQLVFMLVAVRPLSRWWFNCVPGHGPLDASKMPLSMPHTAS